jgi:hypothetical protein
MIGILVCTIGSMILLNRRNNLNIFVICYALINIGISYAKNTILGFAKSFNPD